MGLRPSGLPLRTGRPCIITRETRYKITMRIYLLRHGQTDWNAIPRFQGHTDTELNEVGLAQAQSLADALRGETLTAIYSSPLKRAFVTAGAVAQHHALEIQPRPGLMEMHHGQLEGMETAELRRRYSDVLDRWYTGDVTTPVPGGESMQQLQDRAWAVAQEVMERHAEDTVALVSHNLTILTIVCKVLEMPLANFRRMRLDTASISVIETVQDRVVLSRLNDISHDEKRNSRARA